MIRRLARLRPEAAVRRRGAPIGDMAAERWGRDGCEANGPEAAFEMLSWVLMMGTERYRAKPYAIC